MKINFYTVIYYLLILFGTYTILELASEDDNIRVRGWADFYISIHSLFLIVLAVFAPSNSRIALPTVTIVICISYYLRGSYYIPLLFILMILCILLSIFVMLRPSKFKTKEIYSLIPFVISIIWYIVSYNL